MIVNTLKQYTYTRTQTPIRKQEPITQPYYTSNFKMPLYDKNYILFTGRPTYKNCIPTVKMFLPDLVSEHNITALESALDGRKKEVMSALNRKKGIVFSLKEKEVITMALGYHSIGMFNESMIRKKVEPPKGISFDYFFENTISRFKQAMYPNGIKTVDDSPIISSNLEAKLKTLKLMFPKFEQQLSTISSMDEMSTFIAAQEISHNHTIKTKLEEIFEKLPDKNIKELRGSINQKIKVKNTLTVNKSITEKQEEIYKAQDIMNLAIVRKIFEHSYGLYGKEILSMEDIKKLTTFKAFKKFVNSVNAGVSIVKNSLENDKVIDDINKLAPFTAYCT